MTTNNRHIDNIQKEGLPLLETKDVICGHHFPNNTVLLLELPGAMGFVIADFTAGNLVYIKPPISAREAYSRYEDYCSELPRRGLLPNPGELCTGVPTKGTATSELKIDHFSMGTNPTKTRSALKEIHKQFPEAFKKAEEEVKVKTERKGPPVRKILRSAWIGPSRALLLWATPKGWVVEGFGKFPGERDNPPKVLGWVTLETSDITEVQDLATKLRLGPTGLNPGAWHHNNRRVPEEDVPGILEGIFGKDGTDLLLDPHRSKAVSYAIGSIFIFTLNKVPDPIDEVAKLAEELTKMWEGTPPILPRARGRVTATEWEANRKASTMKEETPNIKSSIREDYIKHFLTPAERTILDKFKDEIAATEVEDNVKLIKAEKVAMEQALKDSQLQLKRLRKGKANKTVLIQTMSVSAIATLIMYLILSRVFHRPVPSLQLESPTPRLKRRRKRRQYEGTSTNEPLALPPGREAFAEPLKEAQPVRRRTKR